MIAKNAQIVLIRHGKPTDVRTERIAGCDIGSWIEHYDTRGITTDVEPPKRAREAGSNAQYVVTSDLRRAVESAAWIAGTKEVHCDHELREAGLPRSLNIPIQLSPATWIPLARAVWWLDWCDSDETIQMTRKRAGRVANRLIKLAAEYGFVMVVGHGVFNRFLATQLLHRGWNGRRTVFAPHWAVARYEKGQVN